MRVIVLGYSSEYDHSVVALGSRMRLHGVPQYVFTSWVDIALRLYRDISATSFAISGPSSHFGCSSLSPSRPPALPRSLRSATLHKLGGLPYQVSA